jgi:hypothetical protein
MGGPTGPGAMRQKSNEPGASDPALLGVRFRIAAAFNLLKIYRVAPLIGRSLLECAICAASLAVT